MKYDFDTIIDRQSTESVKWHYYDEDVLPMWVADMDFASPPEVVQALHDRVAHAVFGYAYNTKALKDSIINWLAMRHQWQVEPDEIVFMPGVVTAFNLVSHGTCKPGDGVLIQTPAYPPFLSVANNVKLTQHEHELTRSDDNYFTIDYEAFEKSITPDTKLFILCNPHNPTGRVFRKEELEKMAEICLRKGVIICSDEIHCDLVYEGNKHLPIASLSPEISAKTATLMAPSKTFNVAGLDGSFMVVQDKALREQIQGAGAGLMSGVNVLGRTSMQASYEHGLPWLKELLVYLQGNRDYLYDTVQSGALPGIKMGKPEGTYLAWMDCRDADLPGTPSQFFIDKGRVGFNDGARFAEPGEGWIRLNYGCPRAVLEEGVARMKKALASR